jgi:Flp pilus assembly pilin Flp
MRELLAAALAWVRAEEGSSAAEFSILVTGIALVLLAIFFKIGGAVKTLLAPLLERWAGILGTAWRVSGQGRGEAFRFRDCLPFRLPGGAGRGRGS